MNKAPLLSLSIILVLLLPVFSTVFNTASAQQQQTEKKGPYVDQVTFIHRDDENLALEEVKSGNLDAYYFHIPLEAAADAKSDPRVTVYDRTAGSAGLLMNPAPARDGNSLNPFSIKEVRFAMNYLIDRQFVVNEIYKGYGSPLVDPFGIYSPEYLNVIDTVESFGFSYNPGLAEKMITDAMTAAGATKDAASGNKWMFKESPVTVKIMIRLDDASRKSIGELVASKLEESGFTVQKEYGDLTKANTIVYGSNPQDLKWNVYTEGLAGTSVFVKYNPIIPGQMYAPWVGNMPGSQNPSFWNYQNSTLDEITQKIFFANFTSAEDRSRLVNAAVKGGIQESVRIFLAQRTEPFVVSSSLKGVVNDFGAGITSKYSLVNARPSDGKGTLNIGVKQIHQGSWNGIGGLSDTYSRDIFNNVYDSATFRDPYTGEIIPMRTQWTDISTQGPTGKLQVAEDAQTWDPATQKWKDAGPDATATSKVTYKLLYSKWHNGIPMDKSDLLYSQYFTFEWGTNSGSDDQTVDPEYTSSAAPALPLLKGIKFTSDGTLESYVNFWHYDDKEIADFAPAWAAEPWEITAATERLVTDGKFAYSRSQASAKNVDWLDPIVPEHAQAIKEELQQMKSENYVPAALKGIVSVDDAKKRYDASIAWINTHGNAIISNGAFYLDSFNIAGGTITIRAFRDPSYPFEQGHWSAYENPKLATIERVDAARMIEIGKPAEMTVSVQVDGKPSNDALVEYFIFNKDGKVVARGEAKAAQDGSAAGTFRVDLTPENTSKLTPGPSQLKIFANSKYAFRPDISTNTILAVAAGAPGGSNSGGVSTTTPGSNGGQQQQQPQQPAQPSGCLIATAAFGSELTPQVQYLRNFREHYILSTASGAAFMNAFNTVYYSFSPQVADYERQQPWLQATVKTALYPLFGILMASEKAYSVAAGGDAGAVAAGAVASTLIGAVYLWPAALSARLQGRFGIAAKVSLAVMGAAAALIAIGVATTDNSPLLLLAGTSLFVLSAASASAIAVGKLARIGYTALIRQAGRH
ncbi:CFI-box-CTERM domain-containing protein [Nitrososphaera viennensis]|uniref:ABC transporter substrate-binding protein n=1 Tax=Nitrososphaera viennensis TaxID=1034015 RepID=A0A977IBP0_9ARCH|nr:CFI-box-CTERM domain-containing protein [Nitrososphaera viennensis]UVS67856.1 ABC transporter substrate-binding protein [Nitrososphaera viennensis]